MKQKIWIMNFEEVYGGGISDRLYFDFYRHIICSNPGDIFLSSIKIPVDFINYMCTVKGVHNDKSRIIRIDKVCNPYYLCDSIFLNKSVVHLLKKLSLTGKFCFSPFCATKKVSLLSKYFGIPIYGKYNRNINVVKNYNNKKIFKEISKEIGVETIHGFSAKEKNKIINVVEEICKNSTDQAILKKTNCDGKNSNLYGEKSYLLKNIDSWIGNYKEDVIIEKYIQFIEVCGSLVSINDSGYKFLGIDSQIIQNCIWEGCAIPFNTKKFEKEIKKKSILYAKKIYESGGRGFLNLDWAIGFNDKGSLKCYALEANYRYNGFQLVLDIIKSCYKNVVKNYFAVYYKSYPISREINSFTDIFKRAKNIIVNKTLAMITNAAQRKGIIFTSCPFQNKISLIIVGKTKSYIKNVEAELQRVLSC